MELASVPLIEFLRGKIYLGAYDYVPEDTDSRVYLTIDDTLPYNNFHHDFGPLSIAHLYRFAVILHDVLGKPENQGKELVFYSYTDPRSRANAATLLAGYMIIIQSWQPHQVLAPIAQSLPVMPFRDAGYSVADFIITVQDVVYALWRAKNEGLLDMRKFDLEEYEQHELVENGDLNMIADYFVAFASPVTGNPSIEPVMQYFKKHNVQLVVRLNSHLYDKTIFEREGIKHVDLIFEDGSCPTMAYVRGFMGAVEGVIRKGGKVAVHCRAGLGRTGCLIGAHLIYTYGFTAQEAIAYMRFLRPGMVVGPQQHWLYQHQHEFRDWRRTMRVSSIPDHSLAGFSPLVEAALEFGSKAAASNAALADVPRTPERKILTPRNPATVNSDAHLPQPTPGQPRKSPSPLRVRTISRASKYHSIQEDDEPGATNSDDEAESLYECRDDTEAILNGKQRQTSRPRAVSNMRSQPLVTKQRHRVVSRGSGSSRSTSSSRSVSAKSIDPIADIENGAIPTVSRRRNITDYTPQQQLSLAKQLRVTSNPSPRRRSRRESSPPVEQVEPASAGTKA